jgi:hypothetical protein
MNDIYATSDTFGAQETNNRINGLGNILPYLVLRDGAPRDVEGTLYIRDSNGLVYSNKWSNPLMVGNEWQWYAGNSRQGHSLPLGVGYYLWRKDAYAWQVLGSDWQEASNTLIKLGLAKAYVAPKMSVEDAVNERVRAALKKRPNRGERTTVSY